jgi:sialate O-acetylesterase
MTKNFFSAALAAFIIGGLADAQAEVRMPAIFGDHMVLQREIKLPVWGWAKPGEKITATFKKQTRTTVAGSDGKWRIDFEPVDSDGQPATLTVTSAENTLTFTDVLVGDVWIVSGQSNMEFGIQNDSRGKEAIANATDSQIRFFFVPWRTALPPQTNIGPTMPPSPLNGKWLVCSPETMGANWAWHGFSAVGYYFARDIRKALGRPLGMIATYKGGTPAQAWTSISGLEKDPALAHYVEDHRQRVDHFTNSEARFEFENTTYQAELKKQRAEAEKARAGGQPIPAATLKAPVPADGGFGAPANLFNGMVAPLIPYGIEGVLWYQGESNGDNMRQATEYAILFPRMIRDWREQWGQGEFPFLFVQLPNINGAAKTPSEGRWPWVREAQLQALAVPNTGMAVTIDIGDADNLHPPDKIYVGERLALAARKVAYHQDLVYAGPIYDSMSVEGNKIRIRFRNIGGGLAIGAPPPNAEKTSVPMPSELSGFGIAGDDRHFVWAEAVIDGNTVLVSAEGVPHPISVRYDWAQNPPGDLYNKEGLPASPFRTDDWPPAPTDR